MESGLCWRREPTWRPTPGRGRLHTSFVGDSTYILQIRDPMCLWPDGTSLPGVYTSVCTPRCRGSVLTWGRCLLRPGIERRGVAWGVSEQGMKIAVDGALNLMRDLWTLYMMFSPGNIDLHLRAGEEYVRQNKVPLGPAGSAKNLQPKTNFFGSRGAGLNPKQLITLVN